MRLQARTVLSAITFGRGERARVAAEVTGGSGSVVTADSFQSLATELNQTALEGVFQYPRNWVFVARAISAALFAAAIARIFAIFLPLAQTPEAILPRLMKLDMLGLIAGTALAAALAGLFANLFPTLRATPQGLGITEMRGWRRVSWDQVGVLRVMELQSKGRFVVFVPIQGRMVPNSPAPMLELIPLLAGAARRGERGVLITSDIKDFDRLIQLILSHVAEASGQNPPNPAALVQEGVLMPAAQLILDPVEALARLSHHADVTEDPYGVTTRDTDTQLGWREMYGRQLPLAAAPAALLLMDMLTRHPDRPPGLVQLAGVLALLLVGLAELPFIARLVEAVGDLMVGTGYYKIAARSYLELQVPRALLVGVSATLLGIGLPVAVAQSFWLAGIVLTTLLATRFVQRLYYLPTSNTILPAVGTFIFQVFVMGIYLAVR